MREKIFNRDFSGHTFEDRFFDGYYNNCNLSDAIFVNCTFHCVAKDCNFNRADFRTSTIERIYSPGSTFRNAKFPKGTFRNTHNHQIIAELLYRYVMNNLSDDAFRTQCIDYIRIINDRTDLSWNKLTTMASDAIITHGFHALKNYPQLLAKMKQFREELEPR